MPRFWVRPSRLNGTLFASVGAIGPLVTLVFILASILFILMEAGALVTGIILTRRITSAVAELYDATRNVRRGDFSRRVRVQQKDQLGVLAESFNEMTSSIGGLIEEQRQRQRLENEITIAREVQLQLFPRTIPQLPGVELAAICRAARMVSGDYYDFILLSPSRVAIVLADISGKGISASLLDGQPASGVAKFGVARSRRKRGANRRAAQSPSLPQYRGRSLRHAFLWDLRLRSPDPRIYECGTLHSISRRRREH